MRRWAAESWYSRVNATGRVRFRTLLESASDDSDGWGGEGEVVRVVEDG